MENDTNTITTELSTPAAESPSPLLEYIRKTKAEFESAVAKDNGQPQPTPEEPKEVKPDERKTDEVKGTETKVPDDKAKGKDAEKREELMAQDAIDQLDPKQGSSWKTLRQNYKLADQTIKNLKDEIAKLKEKPATTANVDELATLRAELDSAKNEREQLNQLLKATAYEKSPEFQQKWDKATKQALNVAKATLGPELFGKVEQLLRLPAGDIRKRAVNDLYTDLDAYDQQQVALAIRDMDRINAERQSELEESGKNYDALQARRKAEWDGKQKQYLEIFKQVTQELENPDNGMELFQPRKDDSTWNSGLVESNKVAENAWSGSMQPKQLAILQKWGSRFPQALEMLRAQSGEIAELKKEIAGLKKSTPRVDTGENTPSDQVIEGDSDTPKPGESFTEFAHRIAPKYGIR